jgi:hypothetical protein
MAVTSPQPGGAVIGYVVQSTLGDEDVDPKLYCRGFSRWS